MFIYTGDRNIRHVLNVGDSLRLETLVARQALAVEQGVVRALRP